MKKKSIIRTFLSYALALAFGTALYMPGLSSASDSSVAQPVDFLNFNSKAPAKWVQQAPSSSMRVAQFQITEGTNEAAHVVIYYFGTNGGSADANIARWRSQFRAENGLQPEPEIYETIIDDMRVTTAELSGSYARGIGTGPGGPGLPNQSLIAAVMESPAGNIIFQLWGPTDMVSAQRKNFRELVENTQKNN